MNPAELIEAIVSDNSLGKRMQCIKGNASWGNRTDVQ